MGLFSLIKTAIAPTTVSSDIADRYEHLRPLRLRLNNELVRRLSREALNEGAKRLGILRGGVFVFDNEDESSILMDYCIYNVNQNGRNAVEQYLFDSPPDADSDEMTCLRAMQSATYALVAVLRVEPGVGCQIRNLFTNETRLLADFGLSKTGRAGALLATRLLDFGDFVATSGATLPIGLLDDDELTEWQQTISAGTNGDSDPAVLIRACLQRGASSNVRYELPHTNHLSDAGGQFLPARESAQRRRALATNRTSKAAANRRCGCGSGKMFKNCCGKRQSRLRDLK